MDGQDQDPIPPDHHFGHHVHPGGYAHFGGGHEMMLLSLVQLLFWVGVALLLIWLTYRALRPRGEREPALHAVRGRFVSLGAEGPSALEILRRRFAAGEIDGGTFERMWERLRASYDEDGEGYSAFRDGPPLYE